MVVKSLLLFAVMMMMLLDDYYYFSSALFGGGSFVVECLLVEVGRQPDRSRPARPKKTLPTAQFAPVWVARNQRNLTPSIIICEVWNWNNTTSRGGAGRNHFLLVALLFNTHHSRDKPLPITLLWMSSEEARSYADAP